MAKFYSYFPTTSFDRKVLTDLGVRVKIRDTWLNDPKIYYTYQYQDHDRPEHIALKYYGDEELHWIVMITNNIFDVNFDFPMSVDVFNSYIEDKYKDLGALEDKTGFEYAVTTPDPVYRYQKHVRIISTEGIIINATTDKILQPADRGNGYLYVNLNKHGKQKMHYVHRLVSN